MTRSVSFVVIAGALVAGLAACGGDATAPKLAVSDQQITADVATSAGDAIATDVSLMTGSESTAGASASVSSSQPGTFGTLSGSSCTYDAASGRFACPQVAAGGITLDRSYAFLDASGQPQSAYDAATTDSIDFQMSLAGSIDNNQLQAQFRRDRHFGVGGLEGTETTHRWSGVGTGSDDWTLTGANETRHYTAQGTETADQVTWQLPQSSNPYPVSGSITRDVHATLTATGAREMTKTIDRHVVVTFNGTHLVTLQVGTSTCTLDLDTHAVSGCSTTQP